MATAIAHLGKVSRAISSGRGKATLRWAFRTTHLGYIAAIVSEYHGIYVLLEASALALVVADTFFHFTGDE